MDRKLKNYIKVKITELSNNIALLIKELDGCGDVINYLATGTAQKCVVTELCEICEDQCEFFHSLFKEHGRSLHTEIYWQWQFRLFLQSILDYRKNRKELEEKWEYLV